MSTEVVLKIYLDLGTMTFPEWLGHCKLRAGTKAIGSAAFAIAQAVVDEHPAIKGTIVES